MALTIAGSLAGVSRRTLHLIAALIVAVALCGCSFDLGSLSSASTTIEPPKTAPVTAAVAESQTVTAQGEMLARSGKPKDALAAFDRALEIDPNNAQALYGRGMLYQAQKQHQSAIEDFSAANGLKPQQAEPLLGRATSYLAVDRFKEAASDLDEAVQADPQNAQIWTERGLAYERLGDRSKAAESYARAISLRPKDEEARTGFARVGGKSG
jgi:Tfp pilus assembly protein PilF